MANKINSVKTKSVIQAAQYAADDYVRSGKLKLISSEALLRGWSEEQFWVIRHSAFNYQEAIDEGRLLFPGASKGHIFYRERIRRHCLNISLKLIKEKCDEDLKADGKEHLLELQNQLSKLRTKLDKSDKKLLAKARNLERSRKKLNETQERLDLTTKVFYIKCSQLSKYHLRYMKVESKLAESEATNSELNLRYQNSLKQVTNWKILVGSLVIYALWTTFH